MKLKKVPLFSINCDNDQLGFGSCQPFISKAIHVIQDGDRGFRAYYIHSISASPFLIFAKFFNFIKIGSTLVLNPFIPLCFAKFFIQIWRCKLKLEKAPGQKLGGNSSMGQVLTEKNSKKINECWPKK